MIVNCPKCGSQNPLSNFGKGLKKKDNARWYEPSDEYAAKVCPSCGVALRFSMKTKIQQTILLIAGIFSAVAIFFSVFGWLLLVMCVVALYFIRNNLVLEEITEDR